MAYATSLETKDAVDWMWLPQELYRTALADGDMRPKYEQFFMATMCGSGMILAGIHDGDLGIFYRTSVVESGDIAIVKVGEDSYRCRRFMRDRGKRVRIRREDGVTPDIVVQEKEVTVEGVLVTLIRRFHMEKGVERRHG